MDEFIKLGFILVGNGKCHAYVRCGTSRRAVVCITGFSQPAKSWLSTVTEAISDLHTVVVIVRRQETNQADLLRGWQSLAAQEQEVVDTILYLKRRELIGLRLTLVGHSVGAILARHCLTHPLIRENTDRLVQIAPAPLTWWLFACHLAFWLRGGLLAAPLALLALLGFTRGFLPPRLTIRGLFCGNINQERFDSYCRTLVPDSALVFLQLVFWYNGTKEWQEVCTNWHGHNLIIGLPDDHTISHRAVTHLWKSDPTGESELHRLAKSTPHCYWLQVGVPSIIDNARLRAWIEG